jgi:hypothetical protein
MTMCDEDRQPAGEWVWSRSGIQPPSTVTVWPDPAPEAGRIHGGLPKTAIDLATNLDEMAYRIEISDEGSTPEGIRKMLVLERAAELLRSDRTPVGGLEAKPDQPIGFHPQDGGR